MNQRVFDILGLLIEQVVHEKNVPENGAELVQRLMKLGYNIDEIDEAFDLIFANPEKVIFSEYSSELHQTPSRRVFRIDECNKINIDARGALISLMDQRLIDRNELEDILHETLKLDSGEVGLDELHQLMLRIIDDETRLSEITSVFWSKKDLPKRSREDLI